jgi:hypothetical protein
MTLLNSDEYEELNRVLHNPNLSHEQSEVILRVVRKAEGFIYKCGVLGDEKAIIESDRDNRRRRMDIARAILDETQVHDLDRIAEIVWPSFTPTLTGYVSDPTQQPTQLSPVESCGYKEQLGSHVWRCTREKGHSGHHHLGPAVIIQSQCDGEHGGPPCGDPHCWNNVPTAAELGS